MKVKSKVYFIFSLLTISFLFDSCSRFEYLTGSEVKGFSDGSVIDAKFNYPTGMDVDDSGNLYVMDQNKADSSDIGNHSIRKISPESKVSTVVKFGDEEKIIDSIKIKDNYLYFANRTSVKRINLKGDIKIESIVGTDEKKDLIGDFEVAKFNFIQSITISNDDKLFILDYLKIKKANLKTKKVEGIKFQKEGSTAYLNGISLADSGETGLISQGGVEKLTINPQNNQLYFISFETFTREVFQINSINQIIDLGISGFPDSFTFDNEGNMYVVSIGYEKLLKVSPDKKIEEISRFGGVLKIEKGSEFPEFGHWDHTNLAIDNNRKILFMSTSKNKIYKLNLKR